MAYSFLKPDLGYNFNHKVIYIGVDENIYFQIEFLVFMLNIEIKIKCFPQQLIVTERMPELLRTVITVAHGKLSLN